MTTPLTVAGGQGGTHSSFCKSISTFRNSLVLVANAAQDVVITGGASLLFITSSVAGTNFWVDEAKTAVIPTVTTVLGTAPMLNPGGLIVTPSQRLSFISDSNVTLILEYY